MAAVAPTLLSRDATPEILLLHTAIDAMGIGVTSVLLRALILLRRSGESLPGLLSMIWAMLAMELSRAAWLAFQWLSKPAPPLLDVLSVVSGFVVVIGIPVIVSARYLPKQGAYNATARPWAWLEHTMAGIAVLGSGALVCALLFGTRAGVFLGSAVACVSSALLLLMRIAMYRHSQVRRRPLVLFALCTVCGLLLMAASTTYSFRAGVRIRESFTLTALNVISLMLILCGVIFVFANVRLADVIVKRALRIVLWASGTVAISLVLTRCFTLPFEPAAKGLICLSLFGLAISVAPVAERCLNRWIDAWVFEQVDFQTAIPLVWREIIQLESQDAVFHAAERFLQNALSLAAVRIVPLEDDGDALRHSRPGPYFVPPSNKLARVLSPPAGIVVPLFSDGQANHAILLGLGTVRPSLTALETGFVERVGGQVQIRLGMLLAEQRRAEQVRRETLFREQLFDAELRALRAQVNPHFLFNSLNTIADLTAIAPEQAEEMTLRLSAVFRYVLINTDRHFSTLREELDFVRSYLHIEQTRFGDRLKVSFDIDPATLDQTMPTLLLQPLIENALKHGISPKRGGGLLTIRSEVVADGIFISVSDDGLGLRGNRREPDARSTSVGLENVSNRLRTAYGGRASLNLRARSEGGTEAAIVIPRSLEA